MKSRELASSLVPAFAFVALLALVGFMWLRVSEGSAKRQVADFELDKRSLCDGGLIHCTISQGKVGGYQSKWTTCECATGSP